MAPSRTRPIGELLSFVFQILAVWLLFALFSASEFYRRGLASGHTVNWTETLVVQLVTALQWTFFTPIVIAVAERYPIRGRAWARNLLILGAFTPVLALIRAAVGGAWLQIGERGTTSWSFVKLSVAIRFHRNVFLTLVIIGLTHIVMAYREAAERERKRLALDAAVANSALAELRARMLPRVMFNSLHAIEARVESDPAGADRMIVQLSDLLRGTLDLDRRDEITVGEELDHLDRYLELEKGRVGGRLSTHLDFDEDALALRVPPLLIRTVFEVAIAAEGIAEESRIEIRGKQIEERLRIEIDIAPPGGGSNDDELEEARKRLQSLFPGRFLLERWRQPNATSVVFELPVNGSEGTA
jgi:hypothetical protein